MNPRADACAALGPVTVLPTGEATAEACFPATLPVFAGHFPGAPLVPGVHQLALVAEIAARAWGVELAVITRTKWLVPVRPEDRLTVTVTRDAGGGLSATVANGATITARVSGRGPG